MAVSQGGAESTQPEGHRLYDFAEAAERLNIPETWLRRHTARLPKWKPQGSRIVRFTDDDLERIRAMFHVEPEQAPTVQVEGSPLTDLSRCRAGRREGLPRADCEADPVASWSAWVSTRTGAVSMVLWCPAHPFTHRHRACWLPRGGTSVR